MTPHVSLRLAFAALLAALIVASGVPAGAARGQDRAVATIVICTGQGLVVLALDGDGQPAGPAHFCPDCVIALAAPPASNGAAVRPAFMAGLLKWTTAPGILPDDHAGAVTHARGPPPSA